MKYYSEIVQINTKKPNQFIDITEKVNSVVKNSKIKNGMVFINSMHNTATILIQENDKSIFEDMKDLFEEILPIHKKYHHSYEGSINAVAHLKTNLVGQTLSLPVISGRIALGTWQRIIFVEWFEARKREIIVTVMGEI